MLPQQAADGGCRRRAGADEATVDVACEISVSSRRDTKNYG